MSTTCIPRVIWAHTVIGVLGDCWANRRAWQYRWHHPPNISEESLGGLPEVESVLRVYYRPISLPAADFIRQAR